MKIEMAKWKKSDRIDIYGKIGRYSFRKVRKSVISDAVAGFIVNHVAEKGNHFVVGLPDGRQGMLNKKTVSEFL